MGHKNYPPIKVPDDPAILGYLAGLIDGEGCITAFTSKGTGSVSKSVAVKVVIANTDLVLMEWLVNTIGGGFCVRSHRGKPQWKQGYDWALGGKNSGVLLRAVLPYLVIKRGQAEAAIRISNTVGGRGTPLTEETIATRDREVSIIRTLNQRGSAVAVV